MANEVPVCDVLCEAMEYLSKLGTNLRSRSENLKEKRISKEKLKNAHAVQKAANKVLLICELSKKSLDNVETGVRKVLSLIDKAQGALSSNGAKSSDCRKENKSAHFIEYKSQRLRIATEVSLKHYMSVKVLARRMSTSMQSKYPVYYNCKLYRSRLRNSEKNKSKNEEPGRKYDSKGKEPGRNFDDKGKSDTEHENNLNTDHSKDVNRHPDLDTESNKSLEVKIGSDPKNVLIETHSNSEMDPKVHIEQEKSNNEHVNYEIEKVDKSTTKKRNLSSDSNSEENKKVKKFYGPAKDKKIRDRFVENKNLKIKSNTAESEESSDSNEINCKQDIDIESNSKSIKDLKKKQLHKIHEEPHESAQVKPTLKEDEKEETNTCDIKASGSCDDLTNKEDKPLIRCVNINKLLKPDVVDISSDPPDKSKLFIKTYKNNSKVRKKDSHSTHNSGIDKSVTNQKSDEEFWVQKREEVKAFKPKMFSVNISRLPKLSATFLSKYGLVRVVKRGDIIFEVEISKTSNTNKSSIDSISNVKTALLNDSDSDEKSSLPIKSKRRSRTQIESDSEQSHLLPSEKKIYDISESDTNINNTLNVGTEEVTQDRDSFEGNINTTLVENPALNKENTDKDETLDQGVKDIELNKSIRSKGNKNKNSKQNKARLSTESDKVSTKDNELNISKDPISTQHDKLSNLSDEKNEQVETKKKQDFQNIKEALLNDTDQLDDHESETEKMALLYESDSDNNEKTCSKSKNNTCLNNESKICEINKVNDDPKKIKDALLNDSDSDENEEDEKGSNKEFACHNTDLEKLAKTVTDIIKSNLLNDSDSDQNDSEMRLNSKMEKCSDEVGNNKKDDPGGDPGPSLKVSQPESSENEPTPIKVQRVKSSLLNESSDSTSNSESKKKSKMKLNAQDRSAKKKLLDHSSSSDAEKIPSKCSSEEDLTLRHKRKHYKKRSRRHSQSSSLSSDDIMVKPKKKLKCDSGSSKKGISQHSGDNQNSDEGSPNRLVDTKDELSNSKSKKMVRSKAKPSGSSGQSSDNQDTSDKDIDGLTNLNSLNKARRRDSTSTTATNNTQSTMSTRRSSRPKAKSTIGDDFLQAESSSDSSEEAGNDDQDMEDLPPVPLTGLNGGGIDHLAKDDLLGDTDSSVSNKEKSDNADSEEDNKVKLKRRKAQAISSGSEGGTSRKKDKEFKMSDFEDSEYDSSETGTKSKRKKKKAESDDGSGGSSDGGKKKRRRIKIINDSDASGSGSDTENEGRNKHGRKNIRKVMGKNQLEEATKKAAREEKERIARITERQKLYNNLEFDESGKPDEVVLEKVVLDFDPETKEPLIEVDRGLVKKLKPHQANGIKFMWDACFESVKRIKKDRGSGCILAHCMGLGKTLQVVSLTHTLLIHGDLTSVNRVLVVCPLSTVLNWVNEFRMWLKHAHSEYEVDVYELSRFKQNSERAFQLQQWFEHGGVCVLGYEMFRNLSADNNKKFKKKMLKSFQESLVDPGPDLVVCDEGHLLKNEKTSLSQSMNRVRTRRRIVLTGTPLQNNLKEYYCMVQFVKPNLLGKYNEYLNRFVNPITNGQYTDSTEHDIKIMKRRSHVLHKMLDGAVQRRDYGVLAPFLPPKHEFVLFITLTELQTKLYQFYLDNYSRRPMPGKSSGFLFPDFQSLQRIWTHPLVLKYNSERYEIMQQKKREREEEDSEGSLVDFIDDDSTPDESTTEESSDDLSDASDDSRKKKKKKAPKKSKSKDSKPRRGTRANPVEMEEEEQPSEEMVEVKNENPTEWWIRLVEEDELDDMRNSSKLVLLFDILRQCEAIGDKLLVFSQSLYSLDLIEHFLGKVDEATQEGRVDEKLGGHVGSWSPGIDYFRLDGSTSCENRSIWCKNFNREDNPRARLFLISTRAGGLGINLVAANRVIIFDVSWNPSHDVQSIFRVYRFGQKKPCYIYRFLAMGTMEEKIYERQVTKQAISKRVIDEQQIDRHYAENDLAELYKFEPTPPTPRPVPSLPKDRLFAEMLKDHEAQIYKFHEHDSLLENKEEETLSEEERKAAWDDFENEKNRPPPAPFVAPWPMHNGMMPGLLQQQQLAYAALAAMLRKDMPNINDNQIRDMLPLIYGSNPGMFGGYDFGLMQKMNEIYKYAQPGMMNPSMMNPAMNPAAGGGAAGAGGTSGLQYSPPWQRQQQQQQQMRLQQIMQQQQNVSVQQQQMGAKFYAGGLGSRDPIAMALQQQRAREIMMGGGGGGAGAGAGGGGGRPRGRPPLQPRVPPAPAPPVHAPQDVVNLDSD